MWRVWCALAAAAKRQGCAARACTCTHPALTTPATRALVCAVSCVEHEATPQALHSNTQSSSSAWLRRRVACRPRTQLRCMEPAAAGCRFSCPSCRTHARSIHTAVCVRDMWVGGRTPAANTPRGEPGPSGAIRRHSHALSKPMRQQGCRAQTRPAPSRRDPRASRTWPVRSKARRRSPLAFTNPPRPARSTYYISQTHPSALQPAGQPVRQASCGASPPSQ